MRKENTMPCTFIELQEKYRNKCIECESLQEYMVALVAALKEAEDSLYEKSCELEQTQLRLQGLTYLGEMERESSDDKNSAQPDGYQYDSQDNSEDSFKVKRRRSKKSGNDYPRRRRTGSNKQQELFQVKSVRKTRNANQDSTRRSERRKFRSKSKRLLDSFSLTSDGDSGESSDDGDINRSDVAENEQQQLPWDRDFTGDTNNEEIDSLRVYSRNNSKKAIFPGDRDNMALGLSCNHSPSAIPAISSPTSVKDFPFENPRQKRKKQSMRAIRMHEFVEL